MKKKRTFPLLPLCAGTGILIGATAAFYFILVRFPFAPSSFIYRLFPLLVILGLAASVLSCLIGKKVLPKPSLAWITSAVLTFLIIYIYLMLFGGSPPNVILIVSDATRADHLHCYGYDKETTPNLDELAREGVLFNNAIAQGSHTIVATPAIISSIYPSQHGMSTYRDILSDSVMTIAEVLQAQGYETIGISTNPHLTKQTGFDQGFDRYKSDSSWLNTDAEKVIDEFLGWLTKNGDRRFFAFLFLIDPHSPYEPPFSFLKRFGGDENFIVNDWNVDSLSLYEGTERDELLARYDGELSYLDFHIGRLVKAMKRSGIYDNTVIVYTSDHGEAFWDHGRVGHGDTLYDELLRIPLIMKTPKLFRFPELSIPPGRREFPVGQIDIMPTILDLLGISIPKAVQGISLLTPVFGKTGETDRLIFSEDILLQLGPYNIRSVRDGKWKFILNQKFPEGSMQRELFNLEKDPHERVNLLDEEKETAKRLERELVVFMGRMERVSFASGRKNLPTRSMLESLKALGYIQ